MIGLHCPNCGKIELPPTGVTLLTCCRRFVNFYTFCCPLCHELLFNPADQEEVHLLMGYGVRVRAWDTPLEAIEPKPAGTLKTDDLLDFILQAGRADCLAAEAAAPVCN